MKCDWPILFSLPLGFSPGGMTSWAVRTGNVLATNGYRIVLMAHKPRSNIHQFCRSDLGLHDNIQILSLPDIESPADWEFNLASYLRQLPAIMIPTTVEQSFEIAATMAHVAPSQLRVIAWNHSDHRYDYDCISHIEPATATIVANTTACVRQLSANLPHRRNDIHELPHFITTPDMALRHSGHSDPICIGYAGRLEESAKRVSDLLDVAAELKTLGVTFEMRIAGDGPARSQLDTRLEEFSPSAGSGRIKLMPPIPPKDMPDFWRQCDCLLLPSAYEGLNLQMLEAMAAGCVPVVSATRSGVDDFVMHGDSGFTFPIGDTRTAAQHIGLLSKDRSLLHQMSERCRQTTRTKCNPSLISDDLLQIIEAVISGSPRRWPTSRAVSMRANQGQIHDAADEVRRRFGTAFQFAKSRSFRSIALYGAGRHTRDAATVLADSPVAIRAVIDDDPTLQGRSLWGWPIVSREEAMCLDIDAVIISSQLNESQIMLRRREFDAAGISLIPLYDENHVPIHTTRPEIRESVRIA